VSENLRQELLAASIMPLNETDKAWVRENVKAAHERNGWGKLTGAIKDWSGAGAAIAILILGVTQWTAYIEFRTQTNDRLSIIEKKVTTSELQSQISLPQAAFDKALAVDPNHKNAQLQRAQAVELKQNLQRLR